MIDEAAQAVELSTLIPLRYGCKRCVLVGDPKQLPATIMSNDAVRKGYSRSLFARLMDCGHPVVKLKLQVRAPAMLAAHRHSAAGPGGGATVHTAASLTPPRFWWPQYRAHPLLSQFPSRHFYGGQLLDSEEVKRNRDQPFHNLRIFQPFVLFDVHGAIRNTARSPLPLSSVLRAQSLSVDVVPDSRPRRARECREVVGQRGRGGVCHQLAAGTGALAMPST